MENESYIFDMTGTLHDGKGFYCGSKELIKYIIDNGGNIAILSNSAGTSESLYNKFKELFKGEEKYLNKLTILTSGDVGRSILKKTQEKENPNLDEQLNKKVYITGNINASPFGGSGFPGYSIVDNPKNADFAYISVPQLTEEDFLKLEKDGRITKDENGFLLLDESNRITKDRNGQYDVAELCSEFSAEVDKVIKAGLDVLNFNPDKKANEKVVEFDEKDGKDKPTGEVVKVFRQGGMEQEFTKKGAKVTSLGKPGKIVYEELVRILRERGIEINPERTYMIGDTIYTDMEGARNLKYKGILIGTGNSDNLNCNNEEKIGQNFNGVEVHRTFPNLYKFYADVVYNTEKKKTKNNPAYVSENSIYINRINFEKKEQEYKNLIEFDWEIDTCPYVELPEITEQVSI